MQTVSKRRSQFFRTSCLSTWCALASAMSCAHAALAAGTAFGVDTSEVGDGGNCKVEGWASFGRNGDRVATANPSCIADLGLPTEISMQFARTREDGGEDEGKVWGTSLTPKAKMKLVPTAIGSFGFAAAFGTSYDPIAREVTSVFAYVPATLRLSEVTRINVNLGWLQDREADRHFASYGLGFDWRVTQTVTYTIETFGQAGQATDNAWDTRPRFQTGFRYRPVDEFSIDLIYGRNINGENTDWITVGTTVRFPAQ